MSHPSDLPIGELLYTVFNSILEVFLLCLAGYLLARKGILDKKTQKKLNHLNIALFTPALLFSKVAFFLTPSKLFSLWIIPIFFILTTLTSLLISLFISKFFNLKKSQRNFAMAASMFMNSNSLPIALMQSLVGSVKGLKWKNLPSGEEDNKNAMLGRALTYLVVASTMGMILRWSFGVRLLASADDPEPSSQPIYSHQPIASSSSRDQIPSTSSSSTNISLSPSRGPSFPSSSSTKLPTKNVPTSNTHLLLPPARRNISFYGSFPNSPNPSVLELPSSEGSSSTQIVGSSVVSPPGPPHSFLQSMSRRLRSFHKAITPMLTPPLLTSLFSIVIALIPPLQHFLLREELKPVRGMLDKAGGVSIPLTLVVLGGYFVPGVEDEARKQGNEQARPHEEPRPYTEPEIPGSKSAETLVGSVRGLFMRAKKAKKRGKIYLPDDEESAADPNQPTFAPPADLPPLEATLDRKGETTTVVITILSRIFLTPLVLMPLVVWGAKIDYAGVFEDPIFILCLLLLLCSPPALTLAQITQAASGDAFERLIGKTIFWSYLFVTPVVMVGVVVGGVVLARV